MRKMFIYKAISVWMIAGMFAPAAMHAQFMDYGADPSRLKWNRAKLEHYTLIYPRGMDSMAYRYALHLENAYPHLLKTMGTPVKGSFPVVLHPANMLSNGMVSWSPRRMELLTTPSYSQQAESWDRHLALHESRHVIQTGKLQTGFFHPLYYLIGEQSAGISSLFAPRWFFEGDAVGIETAMSDAGRGRLPEFQMTYRAQALSGDSFYSFDKWYLGSYKDYTGDYYALGYDLISFARLEYGADIWKKTTDRYVASPIAFPPLSKAFRHHTGIGFDRLFSETFAFLRKEWESRDTVSVTPYYYHTPETKQYTSYKYPQTWNDSTVIAVKSSLSDIPSLVSLTGRDERRLTYIGALRSRIVVDNNCVYWIENVSGIRWEHENHSALKYYDLIDGRLTTLASHRRYISFAVGDSTIAASLFTEEGESCIVLMNRESGKEYRQYPTPGNAFIKDLAMGGQDTVYAVATGDRGISLLQLDTHTGEWEELMKPTVANITSPFFREGNLYFESGLNGINNIYRLSIPDGKAYRLTSARFGAFQPTVSADGDALLFADYQAKGYRIARLPLDTLEEEEADFEQPFRFTLAETLAVQEDFNIGASELKPVDFRPQPYRKASGLFNIHSWAPVYYNVNDIMSGSASDFTSAVRPGVTIMSQNALNTAITQAAWYYDRGYHHGMLDFLYKGLLPVVRMRLDYGGEAFDIRWIENDKGNKQPVGFQTGRTLLDGLLQVYLPLNLTSNHYVRGIQPAVSYYFTNNAYQQYGNTLMAYFQYMLSEVRLYNYRKMAHQHILPRLGFQLRLQYLDMLRNTSNFGQLYAARLTTYWPGIMPNHSLMLRASYQYQPDNGKPLYVPRQLLESPRGHNYTYRTWQQVALKADYAFPVVSPDLSLGSLAYLRRLRVNLFYDATYNKEKKQSGWTLQSSYGGDVMVDWNMLRLSFPLTTGIRIAQPTSDTPPMVEAIFSVSF